MSFALVACSLASSEAQVTELTMPPIFANDMVLQRSKPVKVWGKSVAGDTITVSFGGNSVQTTVAVEDWSVMLPAMPANATGQTLTVAGSASTKTYTDVLVGEVWLAGGQSNMSWNISQEIDSNTYDTLTNYNSGGKIRFYIQSVKNGVKTNKWDKTTAVTGYPNGYSWSVVAMHFAKRLYEQYNVPVAIVQTATGGVTIQSYISAEAMTASGLPGHPDAGTEVAQSNGYNYDIFVRDVIPYSATGSMWVHGESNAGQYDLYDELLETLIADWRANSAQNLTFLIAQLPGYTSFTDRLDKNGSVNYRYMREAVSKAVKNTTNTAEVVTIDTKSEWNNIHPTDKKPVGDRFARAARAVAYGESLLYKSPSYKTHTVSGDKVTIEFNDAPNGLKVDGFFTKTIVNGFMLAGADNKFYNATAAIVNGNQVEVTSPSVAAPVNIRYNFVQAPQSNLCSTEDLPVMAFRTDALAGPADPAGSESLTFLPDPTPPVPAGELQLAIPVSEDAFVLSSSPDTGSSSGDISVRANYISYLKFNIASLPVGAVITSVMLRMYDNLNVAQANGSNSFNLYKVTGAWSETTVTYNTRPAHDTSQVFLQHQQKGNYKNGCAADFALNAAMFAPGNGEYSMAIVDAGASWRNIITQFDSKDSADAQIQNAAGRSIAPTLFINYTTTAVVPLPPSNLSATPNSATQITLTWTDASPDETGFRVLRSLSPDSGFGQIGTTAAGATSFADTTVVAGTCYYYRVSAYSSGGDSSPAAASATTLTDLQNWRQTYFGNPANSGTAADDSDFESDGLLNLVEYALGTNPLTPTAGASVPASSIEADGGFDYLTLSVTRTAIQPGVTYQVQVGGDLAAWSEDVTVLVNTPTLLKVRDNVPVSEATKRFVRLRITAP